MNIGILGAGVVGSNLGKAFGRAGHIVMYSSRDPKSEKMQKLLKETANSKAGTVAETVAFGELIIVAIGWQNGLEELLKSVKDWSGKILVDTTNRFNSKSNKSASEDIAYLTRAPVVKAFNTIGAEHMGDPMFGDTVASMFIAGAFVARKKLIPLIHEIGFDVVDAGGMENVPRLEALAGLWVELAQKQGFGRDVAFKLLRK